MSAYKLAIQTHPATVAAQPQRLSEALVGYIPLARNPKLIGYAPSDGFFYGSVYAYIAGTPFACIDYYQVSPQAYGPLFGLNIAGIIATKLVDSRLVMRLGSDRIFPFETMIMVLSGMVVTVNARFDWGRLAGLVRRCSLTWPRPDSLWPT